MRQHRARDRVRHGVRQHVGVRVTLGVIACRGFLDGVSELRRHRAARCGAQIAGAQPAQRARHRGCYLNYCDYLFNIIIFATKS